MRFIMLSFCGRLVVLSDPLSTMAAHTEEDIDGDNCHYDHERANPTNRAGEMLDRAEVVVEEAPGIETQASVNDGPDDASGAVIDQEGTPVHAIDACEKSRPGASHRDKPPED